MLRQAVDHDRGGVTLRCVRVRFERGAVQDAFTVTPVPGSEFELHADAVIPSIGQDPDLTPFSGSLARHGALLKVDPQQTTGAERVYAGGDVASMARFVTEAIGMGKRAAREIDRALCGNAADAERATGLDSEPLVTLAKINTFYFPSEPRAVEKRLPAQRLASDAEVQIGFDPEQAVAETERCFSCGTCIQCDNCVRYCPDLAVVREGDGYRVLADYCKGCGLCVKECPTGSMKMIDEAR
jgi:Pyruvate/2-oxoacid:ferredoxin oxidoreductase delta subunit